MPLKMPKTLDIPNIEVIGTLEDIKEWLREFSELMMMVYEHSKADVQVVDAGDIAYLGDSQTNGSWRFRINSTTGNLDVEKRISGSWVRKWSYTE